MLVTGVCYATKSKACAFNAPQADVLLRSILAVHVRCPDTRCVACVLSVISLWYWFILRSFVVVLDTSPSMNMLCRARQASRWQSKNWVTSKILRCLHFAPSTSRFKPVAPSWLSQPQIAVPQISRLHLAHENLIPFLVRCDATVYSVRMSSYWVCAQSCDLRKWINFWEFRSCGGVNDALVINFISTIFAFYDCTIVHPNTHKKQCKYISDCLRWGARIISSNN